MEDDEVGTVEAPRETASGVPLRVHIADHIREEILSARLRPGQPLTELQIAAELQVSRAPVREAIRVLVKEGLLDMVPYKGTTVRGASRKDIEEIYSLREQLEAFAMRRILTATEPPDLSPLDDACEGMRRAAAAGDLSALNAQDQRFHRSLIQLARHDLLLEMWSMVAMRVRQIIALINRQNQDLMQVARNHDPIMAAVRSRDLEEALVLLARHIRSADEITGLAEAGVS